jgi:hypothetical protein
MRCSSWLTVIRSEPTPADARPGASDTAAQIVARPHNTATVTRSSRRVNGARRLAANLSLQLVLSPPRPSAARLPLVELWFAKSTPAQANQILIADVKFSYALSSLRAGSLPVKERQGRDADEVVHLERLDPDAAQIASAASRSKPPTKTDGRRRTLPGGDARLV